MVPHMSDRVFLRTMRTVLVCFTGMVLGFALNSEASIFKMVENAYKVTLVAAFIPLLAGLYWKRATTQGALFAIAAGLTTWISLELIVPQHSIWPPQLVGFLMAVAGMLIGSLLPLWVGADTPSPSFHRSLIPPP
jgi:solute:Na+ symporter, SSS family